MGKRRGETRIQFPARKKMHTKNTLLRRSIQQKKRTFKGTESLTKKIIFIFFFNPPAKATIRQFLFTLLCRNIFKIYCGGPLIPIWNTQEWAVHRLQSAIVRTHHQRELLTLGPRIAVCYCPHTSPMRTANTRSADCGLLLTAYITKCKLPTLGPRIAVCYCLHTSPNANCQHSVR